MLFFTTTFSPETKANKYRTQISNPTGVYKLSYLDTELVLSPSDDHTLGKDKIRLGSFFRTNHKINSNTKVDIEPFTGNIVKAKIVVTSCNDDNLNEILTQTRYVRKGQTINDILILDVKHDSKNVSLKNTYYELTEETRIYARNETINLVGYKEQEKEAERKIYAPLLHNSDISKYNLHANNVYLLTGKKGMHKTKFMKKVSQNLCVNYLLYDFFEYGELDSFKKIYTKNIKLSPCVVIFKNFVTKNVEAVNTINNIMNMKLENKFGRIFVFISNSFEQGEYLKSKFNISNIITLKSPTKNDIKSILEEMLSKIPNNIAIKERDALCELLKGYSVKEIENLIASIINDKIYINEVESSEEIEAKKIKEIDYRKILGLADCIEKKLEKINLSDRLILNYSDIAQHLEKDILTYRDEILQKTNITFNDIGGYDDVKQLLIETVIWPIEHKEIYQKLNLSSCKGLIMHGPPGCAKTLLAKAITNESKMAFISVKGSELENKWVGETDKTIRNLFKKARENSPCVIFIDEIDTIAQKTEKSSNEHHSKTLGAFLTEMDGLEESKDVVVIGATNRIEVIDPAFIRPGRIDKKVYVGLPNETARRRIFEIKLDNAEIDYDAFVRLSENFSGAEITLICQEAKMICLRRIVDGKSKSHKITNDLVYEAFDKITKLNKEV